jgi:glyoxylase-like metal-dependent hydrolase (beta-lactamase superfamily II)
MKKIEVKVFNTTWIRTRKTLLLEGAKFEPIEVPTLFAVIIHPQKGFILFDTGHHTQFYKATRKFPYRLNSIITPCDLKEENNASNQLSKIGIHPNDVKTIIISHGHADHIPGIVDFPDAKIILNKTEFEFMCWDHTKRNSIKLFKYAYLKSLYNDCKNEIITIDFPIRGVKHRLFETAVDLWDDGSMYLVPLLGHTNGHMGLFMDNINSKSLFFVGDAAHMQDNIRYNIPTSKLFQKTIYTSPKDFVKTLKMLHELQKSNPDLLIIPSHCKETWNILKTLNLAVE